MPTFIVKEGGILITFHQVTKKFEEDDVAVSDLSLTIEKGKLTTLIGPSGCGKTTTLKMINKLILPTSGKIEIDGKDISEESDVELRRGIGYVIQRIGLLPHMTIEDNVGLVPKLKGMKKQQYQKRIDELMNLVGLDPTVYRKRYPLELSGGQQQRIGVVRALAGEPPIILMDEPFSALDPISREQLQDELKLLQKNIHKTIVFVTHDMDEALKISDEIVVMKDGVVEQIDTPERLMAEPNSEFVRSFIGEDRIQNNRQKELATVSSIMRPVNQDDPANLPGLFMETSLQEAVRFMLEKKVEAVLIREEGKPLGIVEKNVILKELAGLGKGVI